MLCFYNIRYYLCVYIYIYIQGKVIPQQASYSFSEAQSTQRHMVPQGATEKKSLVTPPGIDPGTVRLVAQCLNHYATPGPIYIYIYIYRYIDIYIYILLRPQLKWNVTQSSCQRRPHNIPHDLHMLKVVNNTTRYKKNVYSRY